MFFVAHGVVRFVNIMCGIWFPVQIPKDFLTSCTDWEEYAAGFFLQQHIKAKRLVQ